MNKKLKRIRLRTIAILLAGILGISGLATVFISIFNKKEKKDINNIITSQYDNTYFDDFIEEKLENDLIELEKYVKLSNELNEILGEEYTIDNEILENKVLETPEEIKNSIKEYNDTKNIDKLKELKIKSSLLNEYLKNEGYTILADAMLYAFKIELVDAYGLDKETSKLILNQITVPGYNEMNFGDPEDRNKTITIGKSHIKFGFNLEGVLDRIYNLQDNAGKENKSGYNYNEERNELLENSFEMLKDLIEEPSEFSKIKIK